MTETEFTELNLSKEVDDMEADEARETLAEFMASHEENQAAYDALHADLEDIESEYKQKLEEREERIAQFKHERAEEAAKHVKMPADLLADRFSIDEIDQILEEADEANFSEDTSEDDDETDDSLTTFSNKEEKGRSNGDDRSKYRSRAATVLERKNFPVGE